MSDVETEILKNINLKTRSLIDFSAHSSHETFGAQFLIGRARGEGGQVAFLRTSPHLSKQDMKQSDKKTIETLVEFSSFLSNF